MSLLRSAASAQYQAVNAAKRPSEHACQYTPVNHWQFVLVRHPPKTPPVFCKGGDIRVSARARKRKARSSVKNRNMNAAFMRHVQTNIRKVKINQANTRPSQNQFRF